MPNPTTVKVSSRYQVALPSAARKQLDIEKGDQLLVDVQGDLLIMMRRPTDYTARLEGLHSDIWQDIDPNEYIRKERDSWTHSGNN